MITDKLGNLCAIQIGRTPSRSESRYWGSGHKWVSISDMNSPIISETKEEITDAAIEEIRCRRIPAGTLLFSFKLTIGKMAFAGTDLYTNEAIAALNVLDPKKLSRKFLYYALRVANYGVSNQAAKGKTLNSKSLAAIEIPLPPLEDQKRIAYLLSKVEGLIAQRKQHLQQLDDLLKSVFLDMFSPSCPNYADWPIVPISELAASHKRAMRTGPFGSNLLHSEFTEVGDVAVLGIDNAVNNKFEWGRRRFISDEKYKELKNYRIYPGDVIVTIMGTIGRSAVIPEDIPLAINTKHLAAITVDRKITNAVYLSYSIHSSPHIRKQLARKDRGAIMSGLNLTLIKETLIPRPPIKRQDEFAQIHNRILALKTRYDASIEHLQTLNDALASLAFKGELDLSQIVLEPWPAEDEATAQEEVATLESSFELPMPVKKKVNSPKSRKTALKNWLSAYSMHLGDAPVEADSFIALVQQKLSDLESDSDIEWYSHEIGIEEYDEMKKWIFEELKSNRLSQNYDDETNRVRVSAAKE